MIQIYTNMRAAIETGKDIIVSNDREFEKKVSKDNLDILDKELIKLIDSAEIVGDGVKTPFGETTLYNISTGCKTAININHVLKQINYTTFPIINIDECEGKAMEIIFDMVQGTNIQVVLTHTLLGLLVHKKYTFKVLDKGVVVDGIYDLIATLS